MRVLFALVFLASTAAPVLAVQPVLSGATSSPIIKVEGGCGVGRHRAPNGRCYRNAFEYSGPVCPHGFHWGREHRHCWPNYD